MLVKGHCAVIQAALLGGQKLRAEREKHGKSKNRKVKCAVFVELHNAKGDTQNTKVTYCIPGGFGLCSIPCHRGIHLKMNGKQGWETRQVVTQVICPENSLGEERV